VKKSHTKADTIWSADIVRSGGSAELLIVHKKRAVEPSSERPWM
jgi:hypothetical protein